MEAQALRVAMISGEYPPAVGGVADYTALLVEHLSALGVECRVLTTSADAHQLAIPTTRHSPPILGSLSKDTRHSITSWGLSCLPRIASLAAACDLVHIQYQPAAYGLRGAITLAPAWLRLAQPRRRVITTFHDLRAPYLFPKAGPLRRLAVRALLRGSHGAIFSDPDDLQAAGPAPGHRWIPIGSNIAVQTVSTRERAALRNALGVAPEEALVGYFGFVNASKGLDTLVEALARLRSGGCAARLFLVGEQAGASDPTNRATAARLQAAVAQWGLDDSVLRTGWLPLDDLSAALQMCDLIALPFSDGASLRRGSLIAALVHGLPIVTTAARPAHPEPVEGSEPVGGPEPFDQLKTDSVQEPPLGLPTANQRPPLEDGRHALLVPPHDPAALANAIARLIGDEALRRRLAHGAAELGSWFSWPTIAKRTLEVYRELMER